MWFDGGAFNAGWIADYAVLGDTVIHEMMHGAGVNGIYARKDNKGRATSHDLFLYEQYDNIIKNCTRPEE